jgi:hypothetical protein
VLTEFVLKYGCEPMRSGARIVMTIAGNERVKIIFAENKIPRESQVLESQCLRDSRIGDWRPEEILPRKSVNLPDTEDKEGDGVLSSLSRAPRRSSIKPFVTRVTLYFCLQIHQKRRRKLLAFARRTSSILSNQDRVILSSGKSALAARVPT